MGRMDVPGDVLYGASTQRAVLNFPVSGRPVPFAIIAAFAALKAACAAANENLGLLDAQRADAIGKACAGIESGLTEHGGWARHFPVDIYQTGSGTSTNMNVNEVIANLVCIDRDAPIGSSKDPEYLAAGGVHPNDHVNMGQSSNDTFPTAMHVSAAVAISADLRPAVRQLAESLQAKASQWDDIVKIGRTHLQDATPIRLGQEFSGYASQLRHGLRRLDTALESLAELAIGGTAVGTGINTHRQFGAKVADRLATHFASADQGGPTFREAENHFEAQHAKDAIVETSAHLRTIAVSLSKIAGDIRLMGMGPRCGLGELRLPAVQPGSSIMPGKVNPVICESMVMVCCRVIGNDAAIVTGGLGGVGSLLELNVAMPMMAASLLESIEILAGACRMFRTRLIEPLEPDEERCKELIEQSLAMCTSLAPAIGYDRAAALAKEAFATGKTVRALAQEQNLLPKAELDRLLDPRGMTEPLA
ncbi:MAG: class II fumarate hydratase [Planctomycetes bacterium]|nr:class II fumarate hydratase [Planctomycetota bacterium]